MDKTTKGKPVQVTFQRGDYDALCRIAAAENRTMAAQVRHFALIEKGNYEAGQAAETAGPQRV